MSDPRILSSWSLTEIAMRLALGEQMPAAIIEALLNHIEALAEQAKEDRVIIEAAEELVTLKREAGKAFPPGLANMAALASTSPAHRRIAAQVATAGKRLEQAIDQRARRTS